MKISNIEIGMTETYSQTISDADIKMYAGVSGDINPVHMSDEYAKQSRFKNRIAHGLLSAGFFSAFPAVNNESSFILNRISLIQEDENFNYLSYKIFRGFIGAKLHNIKLFFKLC